jgi:hypothetical protein
MSDQYSLTIVNNSQLPRPTFAVFAQLPGLPSLGSTSLAWLVRQINRGNMYRFTWDIDWGFTWAAQGVSKGYQWNGSGTAPADPMSRNECRVEFDYNGDFQFNPLQGIPDGEHLQIADTFRIPVPDKQPSSVGVTLNGQAVCAIDAGPSLEQVFTLHPTYFIDAGNYVAGQMLDADSVTDFQELEYSDGNTALTATLNGQNKWKVEPSSVVNFAGLLATTGA